MIKFIALSLLLLTTSCSEMSNKQTETKAPVIPPPQKNVKKMSSTKKIHETKKAQSKDISGTLSSGTLYAATLDEDGYMISFDPFIAKNDDIFFSATSQIVAKLYSDQLKDEAHISIETDIDYTIFTGQKRRYKIVPYKENNGEISSFSITAI